MHAFRTVLPLILVSLMASPLSASQSSDPCNFEPSPLSLGRAIELAWCESPEIARAHSMQDARQATLELERSGLRPTIAVSGSVAEQHLAGAQPAMRQQTVALGAEWTVFDGGYRTARVRAAQASLSGQLAGVSLERDKVAASAAQAWASATLAAGKLDVLAQNSALAARLSAVAQARYAAGQVTRADLLQAKADALSAQQALDSGVLASEVALQDLARLTGFAESLQELDSVLEALSPLAEKFEERAVQDLLASALSAPAVTQQTHQQAAAQETLQAARRQYRPTVSLGLETRAAGAPGDLNESTQLSARLNVPLYTGGAKDARIYQAAAELDAQAATLAQLRRDVQHQVRSTQLQLRQSGRAIESARASVEAAQAALDIALGRYEAGVGTLTEVLKAQALAAQTQMHQVEEKSRRLQALISLSYLTGEITELLEKN